MISRITGSLRRRGESDEGDREEEMVKEEEEGETEKQRDRERNRETQRDETEREEGTNTVCRSGFPLRHGLEGGRDLK